MIVVTSHTSGTRVELWCCLCRRRLGLTQAWMVFPVDAEGHEGKWVHQDCAKGKVQRPFDQRRAVLMRGDAALSHLAMSLNFGSPGIPVVTGQNSLSHHSKPLKILGRPSNGVLFSREFRESLYFSDA